MGFFGPRGRGFYINPSRRGPAVPGAGYPRAEGTPRLAGESHRRGWDGAATLWGRCPTGGSVKRL